MARVRDDFGGVVYVRVNGLVKALRAGDEIPSEALVGGHVAGIVPADAEGEGNPNGSESSVAPVQPVEELEYPGDDATREELNAYAVAIGLTPEAFKNKGDLVAAIHEETEEVDNDD